MRISDVNSYIKELNNDDFYVRIVRYPMYSPGNINIEVIDKKYGVRGTFVTNLSIDSFIIAEKEYVIFQKFCQQAIEYIKKRIVYLKQNKYGVVNS